MNAVAQIIEMDQERDRKTCLSLDLKVTGANRELAQWVADHRGRYTAEEIARWLGCSAERIKRLRIWAEGGFEGAPHYGEKRKEREQRQRGVDDSLNINDKSESDEHDEDGVVIDDDIATPEVLEDNLLHAIGGMNENARIFNKLLKVSALDREAASRINTAIDRAIGKWRSIQSTLEKKG